MKKPAVFQAGLFSLYSLVIFAASNVLKITLRPVTVPVSFVLSAQLTYVLSRPVNCQDGLPLVDVG